MKNKLICLVLCVAALAASVLLAANIINSTSPTHNIVGSKENKKQESVLPEKPVNEAVELTDVGVESFSGRICAFVDSVAYETGKASEEDIAYYVDNSKRVAQWRRNESDTAGADYYDYIASVFEKARAGFASNSEFSDSVSGILTELDTYYSELSADKKKLYPRFDTEENGSMVHALLSIHTQGVRSRLDADSSFVVTVGGGIRLGDKVSESTFRKAYENRTYSFPLYKLLPVTANDDLTLVTLTNPLTEDTSQSVSLSPVKGLPEYAGALSGIDVVSLSHPGTMDYGNEGLRDTQKALEENGILCSYDGVVTSEFGKVAYVTCDISGTEVSDSQKIENVSNIKAMVQSAKEGGASLVILTVNWNTRQRVSETSSDYVGESNGNYVISGYEPHFDAYNKDIARGAIDAGADLVVGTGTHVPQGIELWKGRYIVYSPGNLSCGERHDESAQGTDTAFLAQVSFVRKTDNSVICKPITIYPVINASAESSFVPSIVFDKDADDIINTLIKQSGWFTNKITSFDYVKIEK